MLEKLYLSSFISLNCFCSIVFYIFFRLTEAKTFKIGPIAIRVYAAQNSISHVLSQRKTDPNDQRWSTTPLVSEEVLKEVFECLDGITDYFKATSAAHWIVNRLPKGSDKLIVAKKCLEFATHWRDEIGDEGAMKGHDFAKLTALKLEVENILNKNGLDGNPKYLELLHQNKYSELVMALYEDESITNDSYENEVQKPDINKTCAEIAKVVDDPEILNLTLIKFRLLDTWLPDKSEEACGGGLDETVTDFNLLRSLQSGNNDQSKKKDDDNEVNYWRCVHILQGFSEAKESHGSEYLFQVTFSEESKFPINHQLRALKCLLSVIGTDTLKETLDKSTEDLEERFQNLLIVSQLKSMNLPYDTVEAFQACNKHSLIESILRSCGHLRDGVSLVVDLCLMFKIYNPELWSKLMKKLMQFSQGRDIIKHTLLVMNKIPQLWHLSEFHQAWKEILFEPFRRLTDPPTKELIEDCKLSLQLLQNCPIGKFLLR